MKKTIFFTITFLLIVICSKAQISNVKYDNVKAVLLYEEALEDMISKIDTNINEFSIKENSEKLCLMFVKHDSILLTFKTDELAAYQAYNQQIKYSKDSLKILFFKNNIPSFYKSLDSLDKLKIELYKKIVFLKTEKEKVTLINQFKNIITSQQQIISTNKEYNDFIEYQKESELNLLNKKLEQNEKDIKTQKTIILALYIFLILTTIFLAISYWKIFEKANKKGYLVLIPIYNLLIFSDIIRVNRLITISFFIIVIILQQFILPDFLTMGLIMISIALNFYIFSELAKAFGKSVFFAIGLVFLSFIFVPILAFNKSILYK